MDCENCSNHFMKLRDSIKEVIMTHHFRKDMPDFNPAIITDAEQAVRSRLHKFEEMLNGDYIFRAIVNHIHIVYAVDSKHRLIFLRAFKNFNSYEKFLADKKGIKQMISKTGKV